MGRVGVLLAARFLGLAGAGGVAGFVPPRGINGRVRGNDAPGTVGVTDFVCDCAVDCRGEEDFPPVPCVGIWTEIGVRSDRTSERFGGCFTVGLSI